MDLTADFFMAPMKSKNKTEVTHYTLFFLLLNTKFLIGLEKEH